MSNHLIVIGNAHYGLVIELPCSIEARTQSLVIAPPHHHFEAKECPIGTDVFEKEQGRPNDTILELMLEKVPILIPDIKMIDSAVRFEPTVPSRKNVDKRRLSVRKHDSRSNDRNVRKTYFHRGRR